MQKQIYFGYYLNVVVGLFVMIVSCFIVVKAFKVSGITINEAANHNYYYGIFSDVSGVKENDDVLMMGRKVGKVKQISIDVENMSVLVKISVEKNLKIAKDSNMAIASKGLLDGKAVSISLGVDDEFLQNGDYFSSTSSAFNLEELASKLINKFSS